MEAAAVSVVDMLKPVAKSIHDFASGILRRREASNRRNPIEILKRLQRESFSDTMKLRDRQDKVERVLAFYKSSKGSLFEEASSHVRGEFDAVGALLMIGTIDEHQRKAIEQSIRTGIDSRLTFETTVWKKDTLIAEFVGNERGQANIPSTPLSLAKVLYAANISDWFSAIVIPVGGRCRDVAVPTSSREERSLTVYSSFGPPLLNQLNGSGVSLMVKKSNITASGSVCCCIATWGKFFNLFRHFRSSCLSTFKQYKAIRFGNTQSG